MWLCYKERSEKGFHLWKFCRGTERKFSSAYVLKKCFSAFEKYHTLAKLIINKMNKALSVLKQDVELPGIKKPRLDFDAGRESFPSSPSTFSPGIAISILLLYVIQQLDIDMKTFILTPQLKKLGKAVARRSHKQVAMECMKIKVLSGMQFGL